MSSQEMLNSTAAVSQSTSSSSSSSPTSSSSSLLELQDTAIVIFFLGVLPYVFAHSVLTRSLFRGASGNSSSSSGGTGTSSSSSFSSLVTTTTTTSRLAKQLFSVTFALSLDTLILAIFEIMGVLDPLLRWLTWRIVFSMLIVDLVFVLPIAFVLIVAQDNGCTPRFARVLAAFVEVTFLWLFWRLGSFFPIVEHGEHNFFISFEGAIGRLGVAGVTAAAILSGYGAVATPYSYLAAAFSQYGQAVQPRAIRHKKEAVRTAVDRVLQAQMREAELKRQLRKRRNRVEIPNSNTTTTTTSEQQHEQQYDDDDYLGEDEDNFLENSDDLLASTDVIASSATKWWTSIMSLVFGGASTTTITTNHTSGAGGGGGGGTTSTQRSWSQLATSTPVAAPSSSPLANLSSSSSSSFSSSSFRNQHLRSQLRNTRRELDMLQELSKESFLEYAEVVSANKQLEWSSSTWRGKILTKLGYLLSVYAVYKMIMALINIIFARDPTKDPITVLFEVGLVYLHVPRQEAALYVQPASFAFVGVLVFTSVRGFLLSFSQVFAAFSKSLGLRAVTPSAVIVLLAQVMGMYFVSVLLLLRMSMPEEYRRGVTKAIGSIHFNFFHRWFDVIFLLSACAASIAIILMTVIRSSRMSFVDSDHHTSRRFDGNNISSSSGGSSRYTSFQVDDDRHITSPTVEILNRGGNVRGTDTHAPSSSSSLSSSTSTTTREGVERNMLFGGRRAPTTTATTTTNTIINRSNSNSKTSTATSSSANISRPPAISTSSTSDTERDSLGP